MTSMDRQNIKRGPGNEPTPHDCRAIQAERDALRAEVAALREALERIKVAADAARDADNVGGTEEYGRGYLDGLDAQAALAARAGEDGR